MNVRKSLKRQLGHEYKFEKHLTTSEIKTLLRTNPKGQNEKLVAELKIGCVKINSVIFPAPDNMILGFDILVKDKPDSNEWICYDTVTEETKLNLRSLENGMFDILHKKVKQYGLSYVECNFETVDGKVVKKE